MDRKGQKRASQHLLVLKNRHAKFISEYVKRKFPGIYTEADSYYNHLNTANPNKRDLTKTHQFLVDTTSYTDHNHYYRRKKTKTVTQEHTTTTTATTITTINDSMVLRVPMLTQNEVQVTKDTTKTSRTSSLMPNKTSEGTKTSQTSSLMPDKTSEGSLLMPNDVYEELIGALRADPDLQRILDDFTTPDDVPDDVPDLSMDSMDTELEKIFNQTDQTPLERELSGFNP